MHYVFVSRHLLPVAVVVALTVYLTFYCVCSVRSLFHSSIVGFWPMNKTAFNSLEIDNYFQHFEKG